MKSQIGVVVFSHHLGCFPARGEEVVPHQQQQQRQRQHVELKTPHHHHEELSGETRQENTTLSAPSRLCPTSSLFVTLCHDVRPETQGNT